MIEIKTSLGSLESIVTRLKRFDKSELEKIIANTITHDIQKNTGEGIDIHGNKFKPYTDTYKKVRAAKGYRIDLVDLRITGSLLNSLVASKEGVITTVSVSEEQKAKAEGLSHKRKFIGISNKTRQNIIVFVKQYIGNIINGK